MLKLNKNAMTLEFLSVEAIEDKDKDYAEFPTIIHLSEIVYISDLSTTNVASFGSQSVIVTRSRQFYLQDSARELFDIFNLFLETNFNANKCNIEKNKETLDFLRQIASNTAKDQQQ